MFDLFKMKNKRADLLELHIDRVADMLFPQFEVRTVGQNKYAIDSSVDNNLEAVIQDLRDGYVDETCINTLEACAKKIARVRDFLDVFRPVDPSVTHYIIAIDKEELDLESIVPSEDDPV